MFFRKKSPENTNNNTEQTPSGNNAEADYPAFDPEAAKRRVAEYKAAHPNAVDDVDKAHEMAKAEDPFRTEAADYRKGAELAWKKAHQYRQRQLDPTKHQVDRDESFYKVWADGYKQKALNYEEEARKNDSEADRIGQSAGERYDLDRLSPEAKEELKQKHIAEAARQEAKFYQKTANYKSEHPDAVVDIDKAHFMALAEDPRRTAAIEARKEVPNMQKQAEEDYLEMMRKNAQNREGYPYPTPDEKDIERIKNAQQNIANKVDEASHQDMLAAKDGKDAGRYYDSIHPEFEPDEKWRLWPPQQPSK